MRKPKVPKVVSDQLNLDHPGNRAKLLVEAAKHRQRRKLTSQHRTGRPAARQQAANLRATRFAHDALEMRIKGLTYRQIGERLGVSYIWARELVFRASGELLLDDQRNVARLRAIEGERMDEVHRAMVPLLHGQLPVAPEQPPPDPLEVARVQALAAQRIVNASARRSALFGMDAPLKVSPTDPSGQRRYHELSDEELARLVAQRQALLARVWPTTPDASGPGTPSADSTRKAADADGGDPGEGSIQEET